MKNQIRAGVIIILGFAVFLFMFEHGSAWIREISPRELSQLIWDLYITLPLVIAIILIHRKADFFTPLGLNGNIYKGLRFAFVFTLPVLLVLMLKFPIAPDWSISGIIIGAVLPGVFEEIICRGFLFGQLFRYAKLGFIPAVLIGALIFSSGHIYQAHNLTSAIGILGITALGAVVFSWLYVEWNYNLWVPIGFHMLLNTYFLIFSAGDTAYMGALQTAIRIIAIALAITFTTFYKRKKGIPMTVTRETLFINKPNYSEQY